jgi:hypothetical protein
MIYIYSGTGLGLALFFLVIAPCFEAINRALAGRHAKDVEADAYRSYRRQTTNL